MAGYSGQTPDTHARPRDWMSRMACRDVDPDLFSDPRHQHEARLICAVRCPVRAQCLAAVQALEHGTAEDRRDGVVAGLTAHERWRLDAAAPGHDSESPALVFTGEPPACGTQRAMLRHLWLGQRLDPECWSAEVRRDRFNQLKHGTTRRARTTTEDESGPPMQAVS